MGDFPPQWEWVSDLIEGGQGHTFVVRRSDGSDPKQYVLKRLKNPSRIEYFEREIRACMTLGHPNVLKVLEHGQTPKGKPFLITEYCAGGSLRDLPKFDSPGTGLRFFQQIVAGVAHAQTQEHPIYHLDLKPENILIQGDTPVVGDFGICFIEDGQVGLTTEGPRGSIYYCAPELRGPKISENAVLTAPDVYSLGKVLYWLFTKEVYDGHEEDYSNDSSRHLVRLFPSYPQFAFVDELVSETVRRSPAERVTSAVELGHRVHRLADRVEAGGRVLDLRIPQRCLFCQEGRYRPAHDFVPILGQDLGLPKFPDIEKRRKPDQRSQLQASIYDSLNLVARPIIGLSANRNWAPLLLICDHCGNVQYFRLDLTSDRIGEKWRP